VGILTLAMFMTLDGQTETTGGGTITPAWSDDLQTHWAEANARDGHLLLYGSEAFRFNAPFWMAAVDDESQPRSFRAFAHVMNRLPKVVMSNSLTEAGWNATVASGPLDPALHRLKGDFDGEIVAVGGMRFASSLLASPELDQLRLLVLPCIAGPGRSFFDRSDAGRDLSLVSSQVLSTGAMVLTYRYTR
jgi:dihydrofolate reductase